MCQGSNDSVGEFGVSREDSFGSVWGSVASVEGYSQGTLPKKNNSFLHLTILGFSRSLHQVSRSLHLVSKSLHLVSKSLHLEPSLDW